MIAKKAVKEVKNVTKINNNHYYDKNINRNKFIANAID